MPSRPVLGRSKGDVSVLELVTWSGPGVMEAPVAGLGSVVSADPPDEVEVPGPWDWDGAGGHEMRAGGCPDRVPVSRTAGGERLG
jgi:hypothetical protein